MPDDSRADRRAGLPAGALRRHRGDRARASTASAASPLDVDPRELEQRIVLAYTGAPRNSGTNNWEITKRHIDGDRHIFDCFERIRDTAVGHARRRSSAATGTRSAARSPTEWDNRKRLAPGVTTPAIDDLIARADGGRRDGRQGLRRRRRRLPVLLRSARRARPRSRRRWRRAAPACSTIASRPKACGLENAA